MIIFYLILQLTVPTVTSSVVNETFSNVAPSIELFFRRYFFVIENHTVTSSNVNVETQQDAAIDYYNIESRLFHSIVVPLKLCPNSGNSLREYLSGVATSNVVFTVVTKISFH